MTNATGLAGLRVVAMAGSATLSLLGRLFAVHGAEVFTLSPPDRPRPGALPLASNTPEGQTLLQRLLLKVDFLLTENELLPPAPPALITVFLSASTDPATPDSAREQALLAFAAALVALQQRQRTGTGQQADVFPFPELSQPAPDQDVWHRLLRLDADEIESLRARQII